MKLRPATEAAVVLLAALVAGLPLLAGRILGGHDVATYLMYAPEVAGLLREGTFLPAWAADLNAGFGGPGLLFYPPLVNLPHALLLLAGLPPAVGTGLVAVAVLAASGLAVLAWMRSSGLAEGALAAALVYVVSPYRLVDLYERTALSEHLAFLFPPLVLAALAASRPASPLRRTALVALAVAGLLLSNLPAAVLMGGRARRRGSPPGRLTEPDRGHLRRAPRCRPRGFRPRPGGPVGPLVCDRALLLRRLAALPSLAARPLRPRRAEP